MVSANNLGADNATQPPAKISKPQHQQPVIAETSLLDMSILNLDSSVCEPTLNK